MNQLAIYGWNDKLDQLKQESTYNALPPYASRAR